MNKAYKRIIKELLIICTLLVIMFLFIHIGLNCLIIPFLRRYHNKLYYILLYKYQGFLIYIFIFIINILIFLPFSPYKITILFKYHKINIKLLIGMIFCIIAISSALYIFTEISNIISMVKDFISLLNGNIKFSYTAIFESKNLLPFKINVFSLVISLMLAPIVEEIVFRGVVYNRLKIVTSVFASIIISSLLFAFFHVPKYGLNITVVNIMIHGIFYAYSYEKTQTLWCPIFLHFIYNCFVNLFFTPIGKYFHKYADISISILIVIIGCIIMIKTSKSAEKF